LPPRAKNSWRNCFVLISLVMAQLLLAHLFFGRQVAWHRNDCEPGLGAWGFRGVCTYMQLNTIV